MQKIIFQIAMILMPNVLLAQPTEAGHAASVNRAQNGGNPSTAGGVFQYSGSELASQIGSTFGGIGESPPVGQQVANGAIGALGGIVTAAGNLRDLYDNARNLANDDCMPAFDDMANVAMISCQGNNECVECYLTARSHMDFFRRQLARMSCIYQNTKSFTTSAIAFGDQASGFHAMSGLAWQKERGKINASFNNMKHTYDTKYAEFIRGLQNALLEFETCGNQYGQRDWYLTSGFIYYEMMKERYKRLD
jgi:hypothetical protein